MDIAAAVADILFRSGAVRIDASRPFTFVSGVKSPIYCDNRILLSFVKEREKVTDLLCSVVESHGGAQRLDTVAGIATGAIPFGAWLSARLEKPFVYVRADAKTHGLGKQIEGVLPEGSRVLLVEMLFGRQGEEWLLVRQSSRTTPELHARLLRVRISKSGRFAISIPS